MSRSRYIGSSGPSKGAAGKGQVKKGSSSGSTPMMTQFWKAKREAPGALLFFRMGDFYELFGDDAVTASQELGIALTSRAKGTDALPMAGVPVRAVDGYLMKLVRKGFKVAICEQVSDPRARAGIVDRAITRVVTAGTITEEDALDAREHNYLASLHAAPAGAGLAWVDVSTGRMRASELPLSEVADEVSRISPAELLLAETADESFPELASELRRELGPRITERDPWRFDSDGARRALFAHFRVASLEGYGIENASPIVSAAGALVEYLQETQRSACEHVRALELVQPADFLVLDRATRATLELVRTQREGRREGTLLEALDACLTPMGGRLLREWLLAPLRRPEPILHRQRGVAELAEAPFLREESRELLRGVQDVERLVAKVSTGRANARDLAGVAASLAPVPALEAKLEDVYSEILSELHGELDPLEELCERVRSTLVDRPPMTVREGGLVREGFSADLDELRQMAGDAKSWMARFQASESERTGISGLKIGYNSVFGYFIEIPRGQVERAPAEYVRKQTIKSAERYVTPELKEFEGKVLRAEERSRELEYELFIELRDEVGRNLARILDTAHALARLDVLAGLAQKASENVYVAPEIDEGDEIEIVDGRHPVLEQLPGEDAFVPNDSRLDRSGRLITILTGPNMAGKSTWVRQTALIALMAQIGSFVPARSARIGMIDRIFTRLGTADDIVRGASTFMVEMVEVANIINNATDRSLIVLDEVGRGTSTFDGLALAWAIVEHVRERIGARTLFATHYHQLTDLASRYDGICNMNVAVREWEDEIVFLHKIVEGGTDRSYGIHVARLAGVPPELLARAKDILLDLERDEDDLASRIAGSSGSPPSSDGLQLTLFAAGPSPIEEEIRKLDLEQMSPLEALKKLYELRGKL